MKIKKRVFRLFTAAVLAAVLLPPLSLQAADVDSAVSACVVTNGQPAMTAIVIRERASPVERYAADELRHYLKKITGAELPIHDDSVDLDGKSLLLGRTRFTETLAGATDFVKLGPDGFRLKVAQGHLLVIADPKDKPGAGVLYGVYELLERFGGCGWYASWHEVVPESPDFIVSAGLDETQVPAFDLRQPTWYDYQENHANAYRNKMNPPLWAEPRFGGSRHFFAPGLGNCHTFENLMPSRTYFAEHPEYYCEVDGERKPTQLCLSNPDVLRICTEKVLAAMSVHYPRGIRYYGVSQNDSFDYCKCERCRALDEAEGSPSASILRFVNAIAEAAEQRFPEAIVETLAYQYSSRPPKTLRPRHNVMPCVCTIECDFSRSFQCSRYQKNVETSAELKKWGEVSRNFYVWDYTTDFSAYMYPFANVHTLNENVRMLRDVGVTMLYEQGAWQGLHGDWAELKGWLLAKYLWNPDRDEESLIEDFFMKFYGPAAALMRQSFDALHALPRDERVRPLLINERIEAGVVPDSFLSEQSALMARALRLVKGTRYERNVRYQRLSYDFPLLLRYLLSPTGGAMFCSRHPERVDLKLRGEMVAAAKRILEVIDEPGMKPTVLSEGSGETYCRLLRDFAHSKSPSGPVDTLVIEDILLGVGGPRGYAVRVADAAAENGHAVRYSDVSYIWRGDFDFSQVITDRDGVYRLSVRMRAKVRPDAPLDGEVFWTGVYNQAEKRSSIHDMSILVRDVKDDGYHWYDVGEWTPREGDHLWSGGGRFRNNRANHNGCWVDSFRLTRVR